MTDEEPDEPERTKPKRTVEKVKDAASDAKSATAEKATAAFDAVIDALDNLGSDKKRR
jgi:hypothetical protein